MTLQRCYLVAAASLLAACSQQPGTPPRASVPPPAPPVSAPMVPAASPVTAASAPSESAAAAPIAATAPAAPEPPAPQQSKIQNQKSKIPITYFGALPDGKTLNTAAIQKAIDSLADSGGTVVIPEGTFLSGALFLKPNVNLHLDKNAILKGSTDIKDFPTTRTRIEGHFQDWTPALINADHADHLVIDGDGTLDGSGQPYWSAFRSAILADRSTKNLDVPRPRLLFISNSENVRVADVHLLNSGFWNLHLYKCQHVEVEGLDIRAGAGSPSTDGIDVDSSQFIDIHNTFISNNDDCIALKGTKGVNALDDKDSPPVEHIHVWNSQFAMGNGLITCGSEATVVRDVRVDHCTISGPDTRGIAMLRLKLRTDTPQDYEDIHFSDITLDGSGTVLAIAPWTQYEDLKGQPRPAHTVRNISLTNIKGTFGTFASVKGNAGDTLADFTLENITLKLTTAPPADALDAVRNLTRKNVTINGETW